MSEPSYRNRAEPSRADRQRAPRPIVDPDRKEICPACGTINRGRVVTGSCDLCRGEP